MMVVVLLIVILFYEFVDVISYQLIFYTVCALSLCEFV